MAPREEEKAMEGLLRRKLARAADSAGVCPEPDLLAAYFERSMGADEIERHELHFSQCARCREQLAAMARASVTGGAEATAGADSPAAGSSWAWLWDWRLLAPAAAVLAFVIVATMWMRGGRETVRLASSVPPAAPPVALEKKEAPPSNAMTSNLDAKALALAPPPAKTAAGKSSNMPSLTEESNASGGIEKNALTAQPSNRRASATPSSAGARANSDALASTSARVARRQQPMPASDKGGVAQGMSEAVEVESSAPGMAPAPVPAKPAAGAPSPVQVASGANAGVGSAVGQNSGTSALMTSGADDVELETKDLGKKSKKKDQAAAKELDAARMRTYSQTVTVSAEPGPKLILTPDPAILWRFAGSGFVERSMDGGATWQGEAPEEGAVLVAGAAPSADVCWLVGRDGLILVTKDAKTWQKIAPPVEGDFIAVSAESAPNATVTAADGRKFTTRNGGKKWKPAE